ncbi:MAG: NAD-dependent epimerase/dehydratase family protein [Bdellovibrionota bacterium]
MTKPLSCVLITGSAGLIGTHLAEHYLKQDYQVIGLDNYITGSTINTNYLAEKYPDQFQFIEHDVSRSWPTINAEDVKFIFHLASPASVKSFQKYPLETMWSNSTGLQNALDFSNNNTQKKKPRVIFASTSEIYGSPLSSPQKETDWGHANSFGERSCYDESNRFGESWIYSTNKIYSTPHGLVRIFNTYGPRMNILDDRVPNTFILNALNNKDLEVYGDGQQTRSFCYIDDLINGLVRYADSNLAEPINLGNDTEIKVLDLAHKIIKMIDSKSKIVSKKLPQDDPPQRRPDLTLAKKYLNYSPNVSLDEGLSKMTNWLKTSVI